MNQIQKALLVAGGMIGISLLAVVGIVPDKVAQFAPMALLALFPGAWLGSSKNACGKGS